MYITCIYTKIYCGYFWEACIVVADVLIEAITVPVVAVIVADFSAAMVCDKSGNGTTDEKGKQLERLLQ